MNSLVTIDTTPEKLLEYRASKNYEFFMNETNGKLYFYCNTENGFMMKAHLLNPNQYRHLFKFANTSLNLESLMIPTHDFADTAHWPGEGTEESSIFTCAPYEGYKLIVTSIVTRFSSDVDLASNPLTFTIWKNIPAYGGVVPAISQSYYSIQQLLLQSNSPWYTVEFSQDNLFHGKMIEVRFRYADSDTNDLSKLQLSSKLGEKITVSLVNDTPLLKLDGSPSVDPCYAIFNCKRALDF